MSDRRVKIAADFVDAWRYCPVSRASKPSRECLEDAAKQFLAALDLDVAETGEHVWRVRWMDEARGGSRTCETKLDATFSAAWHHSHGHTVLAIERAPVGVWEPVEDEEGEDA